MKRILFKFLGIVATIHETLSRKSINFVQLNWIVFGILGMIVYFSFTGLIDKTFSDKKIHKLSVEEIEKEDKTNKYLEVEGLLLTELLIEYGKKKKSGEFEVTENYIPILANNSDTGIYVKFSKFQDKEILKKFNSIQGRIYTTNSTIQSEIKKFNEELKSSKQKIRFNETYYINYNELPNDSTLNIFQFLIFAFFGFLLFAWTYTFIKRYVIESFDKEISLTGNFLTNFDSKPSLEFIDGNYSGLLYFEDNSSKNFVSVPARFNFEESGEVLIASRIDASSSFMFFTTSDKNGVWIIVFTKAMVTQLEAITQYYGFRENPGLRFYLNDNSISTLSFASISEREKFLTQFLGFL